MGDDRFDERFNVDPASDALRRKHMKSETLAAFEKYAGDAMEADPAVMATFVVTWEEGMEAPCMEIAGRCDQALIPQLLITAAMRFMESRRLN